MTTDHEGIAMTIAFVGAVAYLIFVAIMACAYGKRKKRDDQEPFDGWPKG